MAINTNSHHDRQTIKMMIGGIHKSARKQRLLKLGFKEHRNRLVLYDASHSNKARVDEFRKVTTIPGT
jgi:hypothetical protein